MRVADVLQLLVYPLCSGNKPGSGGASVATSPWTPHDNSQRISLFGYSRYAAAMLFGMTEGFRPSHGERAVFGNVTRRSRIKSEPTRYRDWSRVVCRAWRRVRSIWSLFPVTWRLLAIIHRGDNIRSVSFCMYYLINDRGRPPW